MQTYLNENLPERWIGAPVTIIMCCWNVHHVYLTCNLVIFFNVPMWKNKFISPVFLTNLEEHNYAITEALDNVRHNMLQSVWQELDYRLDMFFFCHRWYAYWTFLKFCRIGYKIYIHLNILFKFWEINILLLNIKEI